jgi:DNA-binding transcriptional regulator LsrR (DeoR family)
MSRKGEFMKKHGDINRARVWHFFQKNPFSNQKECAKILGLSRLTVGSHLKAIRAGWEPESVKSDD